MRALKDERQLLEQISRGDEQAFNTLFSHYWDRLYNYLMKVTKSREISEEIGTDVFLKLWTGREQVVCIRHMDAFLLRVAHNKAMDFFRVAARNERLQEMIGQSMQQQAEPAADQGMLDAEMRETLEAAISRLSPRRKRIFTMSHMQGLSNEEIARELALSPHTVKNTLADSARSLRGILQKKHSVG